MRIFQLSQNSAEAEDTLATVLNSRVMSFVHLHVHTEYSTDAISKIDELFLKAEALGMPGLAITDHGTISGVPEFLRAAGRHPSVKPIVGCEFWLSGLEEGASHLILLAKNSIGYKNLVKLVSFANTEGLRNKPLISKEKLTVCREGLICTSACIGGEVPQLILKGKMEEAKQAAQWYKELFGEDFYFEVSFLYKSNILYEREVCRSGYGITGAYGKPATLMEGG